MTKNWQPEINREILVQRALLFQTIREFMSSQGVLEVDTPVLSRAATSDPNIQSFSTVFHSPGDVNPETFYLHTSPEYYMKRLLASGSGPIYQLSHVFRNNEAGKFHNPEFTMLEWYQPGFNSYDLMDQINELLQILHFQSAVTGKYGELFQTVTGLCPHTASLQELQSVAKNSGLLTRTSDRSDLLDFIFGDKIIPGLGKKQPLFVTEFPACQSALAKVTDTKPRVAERFELFINGIEIANGYHELCDATEQRMRFEADINRRKNSGKELNPVDEKFLEALSAGLPQCSGVSIGLDRLLMVLNNLDTINAVLPFPVSRI